MRHSKFKSIFSGKALALSLLTLIAGNAAHAAVVFENFTTSASAGITTGTTIGSAFNTGSVALSLTDVIFPQLAAGTDYFVAGETAAISLRNADGTVGPTLFTNFTLSDGGATGPFAGQTEADVNSPFILLPNTSYYFSVTAPSSTAWNFTTSLAFNSSNGVGRPGGSIAYKVSGVTTTYFTAAQGPQLIYIEANAVPEPSSLCLLGLAGAGAILIVRRARAAKAA